MKSRIFDYTLFVKLLLFQYFRSSSVAHLYLAENMDYLNNLITQQQSSSFQKIPNNDSDVNPSHIWMVYLDSNSTKNNDKLASVFKKTPLRLDSYVFGFFEVDKCKNTLDHRSTLYFTRIYSFALNIVLIFHNSD